MFWSMSDMCQTLGDMDHTAFTHPSCLLDTMLAVSVDQFCPHYAVGNPLGQSVGLSLNRCVTTFTVRRVKTHQGRGPQRTVSMAELVTQAAGSCLQLWLCVFVAGCRRCLCWRPWDHPLRTAALETPSLTKGPWKYFFWHIGVESAWLIWALVPFSLYFRIWKSHLWLHFNIIYTVYVLTCSPVSFPSFWFSRVLL